MASFVSSQNLDRLEANNPHLISIENNRVEICRHATLIPFHGFSVQKKDVMSEKFAGCYLRDNSRRFTVGKNA